jgi:DNA-directed RNA polymerase I, II, and III subunit RPABC3
MDNSTTGDNTLFEGNFVVGEVDKSKYDRVARLKANLAVDGPSTDLVLDINSELFPCEVGDNLYLVLATSLALEHKRSSDKGWRDYTKGDDDSPTLSDSFDYVCHGKIYKFEDDEDGQTM